jgi:hypothetical protein
MKITKEILTSLGFSCIRERDKDNDLDGIWYRDGVSLYQEFWEGEDFNFATRTEDGEFKSGYNIKDVDQLESLFKGLGIKLK